jgi:hypothetical protein
MALAAGVGLLALGAAAFIGWSVLNAESNRDGYGGL